MTDRITIVIPIKNPPDLDNFIKENIFELLYNQTIVVDSGGGEAIRKYADIYIDADMEMAEARKLGYMLAEEEYILNLDCDVVIPKNYISVARFMLSKDAYAGAVSLFIDRPSHHMGILDFGCSLWKAALLKELYDYGPRTFQKQEVVDLTSDPNHKHLVLVGCPTCECWYMWKKMRDIGKELLIVPEIITARHLK